jgi:hypothetical protein
MENVLIENGSFVHLANGDGNLLELNDRDDLSSDVLVLELNNRGSVCEPMNHRSSESSSPRATSRFHMISPEILRRKMIGFGEREGKRK